MLARFSHRVTAEIDDAIYHYVNQVSLAMREDRALVEKREDEEDAMGARGGHIFWQQTKVRN